MDLNDLEHIANETREGPVMPFSNRVDHVCKAFQRGYWTKAVESHLSHPDSTLVATAVMRRAAANPRLRAAIMKVFSVGAWDDVPWQAIARRHETLSRADLRKKAEAASAGGWARIATRTAAVLTTDEPGNPASRAPAHAHAETPGPSPDGVGKTNDALMSLN